MEYFGIDLHQKHSEICGVDAEGRVKYQERVATTEAGLRRVFGRRKSSRVVLESGCQTTWAARLLQSMGHEVVIVKSSTGATDRRIHPEDRPYRCGDPGLAEPARRDPAAPSFGRHSAGDRPVRHSAAVRQRWGVPAQPYHLCRSGFVRRDLLRRREDLHGVSVLRRGVVHLLHHLRGALLREINIRHWISG